MSTGYVDLLPTVQISTSLSPWHLRQQYCTTKKKVVKLLLESYTDITIKNRRATDALYIPSKDGNRSMVELLLENGADVKGGQSALRRACKEEHVEILKLFLQRNGGVNVKETGPIALFMAIKTDREDIVKQLLQLGVEVDKSILSVARLFGIKTLKRMLEEHCTASLDIGKAFRRLAKFLRPEPKKSSW
ncbi:ankyrin repeat-containing domain protein [Paraphoma chrysanthemicola]|nr:ankyrin repeat-containing domain protein [Paraphoma chrysanthemicola]